MEIGNGKRIASRIGDHGDRNAVRNDASALAGILDGSERNSLAGNW